MLAVGEMTSLAAEVLEMNGRRAFALGVAAAVAAVLWGTTMPAWLHGFLRSAALFLGAWLAISVVAAALLVRWFRARARANEHITADGREVIPPGEHAQVSGRRG